MESGEILNVLSSISAKTGFALTYKIEFAVAIKLKDVVITSSPSFISIAIRPVCKAAVPELVAIAYFVLQYSANLFSNSSTFFPVL